MTDDACCLDAEQRNVVETQIAETCAFRSWKLHAVNCRSNHVHVVVTASAQPQVVRNQLKTWCTRRLKELEARRRETNGSRADKAPIRENWWTERGSHRFLNDQESLEAAIWYVGDGQDQPGER
jgi:REP element-mobilizing transposase RayT